MITGLEQEEDDSIRVPDLDRLKSLVETSDAYQCLITQLRCNLLLAKSEPDMRGHVRNFVLSLHPRPPKMSRRNLHDRLYTRVYLEWDPIEFLDHEYTKHRSSCIETVITLSGTHLQSQAATCKDYLRQTWPQMGCMILDLIKDVLRSGYNNIGTGAFFFPFRYHNTLSGCPHTSWYLLLENLSLTLGTCACN
jgi:hypothetical protein